MHQSPFWDEDEFERVKAEHIRKVAKLWDEVMEGTVSDDEAKDRLEALRWEQERLNSWKAAHRVAPPVKDAELKKTVLQGIRTDKHPMDFKCQCTRCVRLHTITMEDAKFLKSIGIIWGKKRGRSKSKRTARGV